MVADLMMSCRSLRPMASLGATGPRDKVATAACSRGYGSMVASPHRLPGCRVVVQKVSLLGARPTA